MNRNKHQKLVLAIAAVLAFTIWLFPHWRAHAHTRAQSVWRNAGYSFLFASPDVPSAWQKLWREHPGLVQIDVVVDWQRQFFEWGTLVFLTGFALGGLALWDHKPAAGFGSGRANSSALSQNQPNQVEQ